MLYMMHRSFFVVENRIMRMPMGHLRLVGRAGIVFFRTKSGSLLMMVCCLFMVGGGGGMVWGATHHVRRHPNDFRRSDGNTRAGVRWFRQVA